jgi:hypothetical protein
MDMPGVLARIRMVACVLAGLMLAAGPAILAAPGPAPAFSLDLFNGKTLRLADLKGTAAVLLFWAEW